MYNFKLDCLHSWQKYKYKYKYWEKYKFKYLLWYRESVYIETCPCPFKYCTANIVFFVVFKMWKIINKSRIKRIYVSEALSSCPCPQIPTDQRVCLLDLVFVYFFYTSEAQNFTLRPLRKNNETEWNVLLLNNVKIYFRRFWTFSVLVFLLIALWRALRGYI